MSVTATAIALEAAKQIGKALVDRYGDDAKDYLKWWIQQKVSKREISQDQSEAYKEALAELHVPFDVPFGPRVGHEKPTEPQPAPSEPSEPEPSAEFPYGEIRSGSANPMTWAEAKLLRVGDRIYKAVDGARWGVASASNSATVAGFALWHVVNHIDIAMINQP